MKFMQAVPKGNIRRRNAAVSHCQHTDFKQAAVEGNIEFCVKVHDLRKSSQYVV